MNMHRIARSALVLLAAVTFARGAALMAAADPLSTQMGEVATPNHDPHRVCLMGSAATPAPAETAAWNPVILRAEPEPAERPAPAFVAADNVLYARANARLRAAPSTAAAVVARLPANAPLRTIARSTDGAWWQVSLADKRTGYVHRDALTKVRMVAKTQPPPATAIPVATVSPQPVPAHRSQGVLGRVEEAMNWLADHAGPGPAPKIIRAER